MKQLADKNTVKLSINVPEQRFKHITARQLADLLQQQPGSEQYAVIDVREGDYTGGHIRGSVHIPYNSLESNIADIAQQYERHKTVVFCSFFGENTSIQAAMSFHKACSEKNAEAIPEIFILTGGLRELLEDLKRADKERSTYSTIIEDFDASQLTNGGLHKADICETWT